MKPVLCILCLLAAWPVQAADRPSFDPKIGAQLDLRRSFRDASGTEVILSAILGGRPALLVFGYDKCPNLCGVTQQAVASDLKRTGLDPASYRALFVSIDPGETTQDAAASKAGIAGAAGPRGLTAWRFLTGADGGGAALAAEAGMTFERRDRIDQYVHPIAVLAVTPQGQVSRVLPALSFEPRDLRLALVEASAGKLGSIADHVFLLCAGFDASRGQYTSMIRAVLKMASWTTVLLLGAGLLLLSRRRPT